MHVILQPSPSMSHKYRVILPHSQVIDFGKRTMRYYPDHGNPSLMRAHLIRKGAIVPDKVRLETDPSKIHMEMLMIKAFLNIGKDGYCGRILASGKPHCT